MGSPTRLLQTRRSCRVQTADGRDPRVPPQGTASTGPVSCERTGHVGIGQQGQSARRGRHSRARPAPQPTTQGPAGPAELPGPESTQSLLWVTSLQSPLGMGPLALETVTGDRAHGRRQAAAGHSASVATLPSLASGRCKQLTGFVIRRHLSGDLFCSCPSPLTISSWGKGHSALLPVMLSAQHGSSRLGTTDLWSLSSSATRTICVSRQMTEKSSAARAADPVTARPPPPASEDLARHTLKSAVLSRDTSCHRAPSEPAARRKAGNDHSRSALEARLSLRDRRSAL